LEIKKKDIEKMTIFEAAPEPPNALYCVHYLPYLA